MTSASEQITALSFLDAEARKQARMFLWFGIVLIPLALGFPVLSLFTGVPFWVSGIMLVCAGLLGGVCILLAFTRGSMALAHLRERSGDPIVRVRHWVEVNRGVRSLHCLCITQSGVELHEMLLVAGADEERALATFRAAVPVVEPA